MVKELVIYPDERIKITSADVRVFDQKLFDLIENMKDTMEANSLEALSAIQIAVPATVVIIKKENGEYLELINPRIIGNEGRVESTETTAYLPELSGTLNRHEKIRLVYQDRSGDQQSMSADGELSITIQRKVDYTFGGTYIDKLDKKSQKEIEKKLEYGFVEGAGGTCPTTFKRDYFVKAMKFTFYVGFALLFAKFLIDDSEGLRLLYNIENYISLTLLGMIIGYFAYSQYEIRVYKSCTSCQTGNIIGTVFISLVKLIILFLLNYFWIQP
jgi:peptide deformylase